MNLILPAAADPVVAHALGAALAVIFLTAAWHKLRDREVFTSTLADYALVPPQLLSIAAWGVPLAEVVAGVGLLFEASAAPAAILAAALLVVVTLAVAVNLLRGHTAIDCGCGALGADMPLSWALVLRNLALVAMLPWVAAPALVRELVWLDYLSVAGATLAVLGIYALVSQMLSIQPRLGALRNM